MQKIEKDHVLEVRSYLLTLQESIISMANNYDKQNFLFVTMLVLAHSFNKLLNLIVKK